MSFIKSHLVPVMWFHTIFFFILSLDIVLFLTFLVSLSMHSNSFVGSSTRAYSARLFLLLLNQGELAIARNGDLEHISLKLLSAMKTIVNGFQLSQKQQKQATNGKVYIYCLHLPHSTLICTAQHSAHDRQTKTHATASNSGKHFSLYMVALVSYYTCASNSIICK